MSRFAIFAAAAAALMIATGTIYAAEKTHDGKVVSVSTGKLVMTDNQGKNKHSHVITAAANITLDGKVVKLADLKAGDQIKVTQDGDGKVTAVAAMRK